MNTPQDLKYTDSHEWVRDNDDGTVTIGITDHAQELLGDLVFVDLPDVNAQFGAGDEVAVVESVKAASDVYTPVSGTISEVNEELLDSPEKVNESAFEDGWLCKIKTTDDLSGLMDAKAYRETVENEDN